MSVSIREKMMESDKTSAQLNIKSVVMHCTATLGNGQKPTPLGDFEKWSRRLQTMCFSLVRLDDQLAEQVMEKYVTSEGEIFQVRS